MFGIGKEQDSKALQDPTTQEQRAAIHRWLDERIKPAIAYWRPKYAQTQLNFAFYEGDSTAYLSPDNVLLHDNSVNLRYPRRTCNMLAVFVDAVIARILSQRVAPMPIAGRGGQGWENNKKVARLGASICKHHDHLNDVEQEDQRLCLFAMLGDVAFRKSWFDPSLPGKQRQKNEETGESLEGTEEEAKTGDIVTIPLSMLDVVMEPCTDIRFMRWIVHVFERPLGWVRENYENGWFVSPSASRDRGEGAALLAVGSIPNAADPRLDDLSRLVPIYEAYEMVIGEEEEPGQWERMTWCEDTILEEPVRVPVDSFTAYYSARGLRNNGGLPLATDLISLQRELDQTLGRLAYRSRLLAFNKDVLPPGMMAEMDYDNSPDPIQGQLDEQGRLLMPQEIKRESLDAKGHIPYIQFLIYMMAERAGIHETSRGQEQSNITSGKQATIAANQDNTNLQRMVSNWRLALEKHYFKILKLAKAYYPQGKLISIVGKDNVAEVEEFEQGLLDQVTAVQMQSTSRIPMEPAQVQDFAIRLAEMGPNGGMFAQGMEEVRNTLFEFLGFNRSVEQEIDEMGLAMNQAIDENERMMKGEMVPVGDWDNDPIHVRAHTRLPMSAEYKQVPDPIKINVSAHIQSHLDKMVQDEMGPVDPAAAMQEQIGAPGQPATAPNLAPPPGA